MIYILSLLFLQHWKLANEIELLKARLANVCGYIKKDNRIEEEEEGGTYLLLQAHSPSVHCLH